MNHHACNFGVENPAIEPHPPKDEGSHRIYEMGLTINSKLNFTNNGAENYRPAMTHPPVYCKRISTRGFLGGTNKFVEF